MSCLKLHVSWGKFFFCFFFSFFVSTSFRNTTKSWSFVGRADCTSRRLLLTAMCVGNPAGCSISITQALSWNTPRPSIQRHYNSPMVNNHKSNEIHKPLRWCLLSLPLGSSDIHSLEVRAFKPIICSIYAIFPSFYHMNYALCHNLPEHLSSLE